MDDQNILKRHIQPAARKLGLPFVTWQGLRTSHATWMILAGADPKSVQGQMPHWRVSTTTEIYAQIVPPGQRRAVQQLSEFASRPIRSNSLFLFDGEKGQATLQVIEKIGGASRARTDDLIVAKR